MFLICFFFSYETFIDKHHISPANISLHNFRLGAHFTKFHQTVLPSVSGDLEVTDLIVAGVDSPVRSLLSTAGIWGWGGRGGGAESSAAQA